MKMNGPDMVTPRRSSRQSTPNRSDARSDALAIHLSNDVSVAPRRPLDSVTEKSVIPRYVRRLSPASSAQLPENARHVYADGPWADEEDTGDLCVGAPGSNQRQNLELAGGEAHSAACVSRRHSFERQPGRQG